MGKFMTGVVAFITLALGFMAGSAIVGGILKAGDYGKVGTTLAPAPVAALAPATTGGQAVAKKTVEVSPEVTIVATDLKFTPNGIMGKVGQALKINLDNKGAIEHDLAFTDLKASDAAPNLKTPIIKGGQQASIQFSPSAKGNYEFYCTIPGHKEAGMKGMLGVVD